MISDVLSDAITSIDEYLNDEIYDEIYTGRTLEEIKAVRLIMENLRIKLDTPPVPDDEIVNVRLPYQMHTTKMTAKEAREHGIEI